MPRFVGEVSITSILADSGRLCLRSRATAFTVAAGATGVASAAGSNECELDPLCTGSLDDGLTLAESSLSSFGSFVFKAHVESRSLRVGSVSTKGMNSEP